MSAIKTLRMSGANLIAEVVVGSNPYGGDITVTMTLPRKGKEVVEALEPLDKLLSGKSSELFDNGAAERRAREIINERMPGIIQREKDRAAGSQQAEIRDLKAKLQRANDEAAYQRSRAEARIGTG